jgi:hypothetical protein
VNEYNVDFRFEDGVLNVRLSGEFPKEKLQEAQNVFQPLIEACSAQKCSKALIDARDLRTGFNTSELFRSGLDAVSLASSGLHTALVARKDMIDPFFEDVVHNRGGHIGVFTDIEGALEWLRRW